MTIPRISHQLNALTHVPIATLRPFQGELKKLSGRRYDKLKKSILENGIISPFFVWHEENLLFDGHQRHTVFMGEGWLMDVPVLYVDAHDIADAKRKVLLLGSQYGELTADGFAAFTDGMDADWLQDTIHFDTLPEVFGYDEDGSDSDWATAFQKVPEPAIPQFTQMTFTLHNDQAEIVKSAIAAAPKHGNMNGTNKNKNGNALYLICLRYIENNGKG